MSSRSLKSCGCYTMGTRTMFFANAPIPTAQIYLERRNLAKIFPHQKPQLTRYPRVVFDVCEYREGLLTSPTDATRVSRNIHSSTDFSAKQQDDMLYNCYPETNSSPLKIGQNFPKRKVHLSTHWNFQGISLLLISGRVFPSWVPNVCTLKNTHFPPSILRSPLDASFSSESIMAMRILLDPWRVSSSGATFINGNGWIEPLI